MTSNTSFSNIECFECGNFRSLLWCSIRNWDEENEEWLRNGPTKCALKRIENSNKMSREYLNNIMRNHQCLQGRFVVDCFGITRDPTGCYMFVTSLCEENLYQYIDRVMGYLRWEDIVKILCEIIEGLKRIHDNGLYHGNLHGGNFTPKVYSTLMERCWYQDPNKRPKVTELRDILSHWVTAIYDNSISNLLNTVNSDRIISENIIFVNRTIHHNAVYNSRLVNFQSLHEDGD
ncbi:19580_t:CDS:2 [Gigaspora margarita]|uniref:19580_t:CDS:1 n=1 Tax=Gigaspora margarita TaxID=4874 RepID=A0ABN7UCJ2_GIGMA|nr:19580_t:CDS:2 [Gigaspora margarita]